ncbi:MAG: hypothetical protein AAGG01_12295, partial [Planctomycetota bacterium]
REDLALQDLAKKSRFGATPHLDAIAAGAFVVQNAITTSTAGNSAMASLLTGRHGFEHGILSLRDGRRQRLPEAEVTLAEGFRSQGWTTIFSSGSPRHARGFSGFSQGFQSYEAPRLSESTRPAPSVVNGALLPLRAALDSGDRVFAVLSFDDLVTRSLTPPSPEIAAPFVRARLSRVARERADVEEALRTMESDPAKGLKDIATRLARARGSRASNAWKEALRDAHLSVIDSAVGEVLDAVAASGRARRAMVVVTGLRGTLPPGYRQEPGPLMVADAVEIPLALRFPDGARRGARLDGMASLRDVSDLVASFGGFELEPTALPSANLVEPSVSGAPENGAFVVDAGRRVMARISMGDQLERYHTGKVIGFDRSGAVLDLDSGASAAALEPLSEYVERLTACDVDLRVGPGLTRNTGLTVDYEVHPGGAQRADGIDESADNPAVDFGTEAVRGQVILGEGDGAIRSSRLRLGTRAASVQLRLETTDASALDPRALALGTRSAAELPLLFTPLEERPIAERTGDAKSAPELPPIRLRLERADGLWWTLTVEATGDEANAGNSEVLLGVWPPRDPTDDVEVSPDPGMSWEAVPGRLDLVRISGRAPFSCRVKKLGKEQFAVACRTPEGFVPPLAMEFFGQRFAARTAFACVIPDHQKGASEALLSVEEALYDGDAADPLGQALLQVTRASVGQPPTKFAPVDVSDLDVVTRLIPGE